MVSDQLWTNYFYKHLLYHIVKKEQYKIDWKLVSIHPYLPIQLIKTYPSMQWDWHNLSKTTSFTRIQELILLFPEKDWDWNYLSISSPVMFIQNNPTLKWNHDKISRRKYSFETLHTPLEYVLQNTQMPWNWNTLSRHPSLTMDHVFHYPSLPWDMEYIFLNCAFSSYHLKCSVLANNQNYYHLLSKNPHNTIDIVRKFTHKPWDWTELAQNIAFAPEKVYLYKNELPLWRWDLALRNPRLTWGFYNFIRRQKTIHRQFHHLLKNHFQYSKTFILYFTIVIRRFFTNIIRKRIILRKLHLLTILDKNIDRYLLHRILYDYVG